jgi:hypothetical protein
MIIGNLAYAALLRIVNRIRRPRKEIGGQETVVSRRKYNRIRREKPPGVRASLWSDGKAHTQVSKEQELRENFVYFLSYLLAARRL